VISEEAAGVFPYVQEPMLTLGPVAISAYAVLVCIAVVVGMEIVVRRAPRYGITRGSASSLVGWTIVWGFVGAHVFEVLAYQPDMLREDPLEILRIWTRWSSLGGIVAGVVAALVVMRRRGMSAGARLRFLDLVAFAFPFAWIFGRAGCALRHDHLGIRSDHWLAVAFPDGARFDLGLLELLYTLPIAALFAWLGRSERPAGFFVGLFFVLYGPMRFFLDTLRTGDARYLSWTPAQYLCVLSTLGGAALLAAALRREAGPAASPGSGS
jgi:phosphatidylglycerol:prolipoprotein diacylglycerol transferase